MTSNTHPLISVIIPVYNIENYIAKCIESVQNQTYDNIEIILVNDGSTDHSEEVCVSYAQIDERVTYLTKENGGPSSARNKGIDCAKGEYLFFVDGDDFIAPDTLEKLYERVVADHSQIVLCGVTRVGRDNRISELFEPPNGVITGFEALKMAYGEDNGVLYCSLIVNKLYQRRLFTHIRFPEGKFHEDEATVYKLLDQCATVSLISEPFYYYLNRENSTMNLPYSVKQLDGIEASYHRYFYFKNKGGQYNQLLIPEGKGFAAVYYRSKLLFSPTSKKEKERVKVIDRMAREICFDNFKAWSLPRKIKLLAPKIYIWISKAKRGFKGESAG